MDSAIKQQWVAALKSGEFKQGEGALRRTDGDGVSFCCLGVLCELYRKENGGEWQPRQDGFFEMFEEHEWLPNEVAIWAGLDCNGSDTEVEIEDGEWATLPDLNDGSGWDFPKLADLIEKRL